MQTIRRIAMWSGPRNISTAMMRAWENRPDTIVHDEPFYAYHLLKTDIDHPGREEIIATYETDWQAIVQTLTGDIPEGKSIYYQKHMTHHMHDEIDHAWILGLTNCFLTREPSRVINSYVKVYPDLTVELTGIPKQVELFQYVRNHTGEIPPVIDTSDVLTNPRGVLSKLCQRIGVPFDERMLQWRAGKRDTDGIWSKYWYTTVEKSTGFKEYAPTSKPVPEQYRHILDECNDLYAEMLEHRITAD